MCPATDGTCAMHETPDLTVFVAGEQALEAMQAAYDRQLQRVLQLRFAETFERVRQNTVRWRKGAA
jgi:hypothetical protein